MPGFPQVICPVPPGFILGMDLVDVAVDPLISSQAPPPDPGPPPTINITATFRIAGWVYRLLRNLPGGFPFQVQFTAESLGPGPEVVLGTANRNFNSGFAPSGACPRAWEYAIALNVNPPPPNFSYKVMGAVIFQNPDFPGSAFAEGPIIRSI